MQNNNQIINKIANKVVSLCKKMDGKQSVFIFDKPWGKKIYRYVIDMERILDFAEELAAPVVATHEVLLAETKVSVDLFGTYDINKNLVPGKTPATLSRHPIEGRHPLTAEHVRELVNNQLLHDTNGQYGIEHYENSLKSKNTDTMRNRYINAFLEDPIKCLNNTDTIYVYELFKKYFAWDKIIILEEPKPVVNNNTSINTKKYNNYKGKRY